MHRLDSCTCSGGAPELRGARSHFIDVWDHRRKRSWQAPLSHAFRRTNRFHTIVIGGGQSGLAAGYHLRRAGGSFFILDANQRSGDAWRGRWDSLRLFSPAQYDSLPGLPLAMQRGSFPSKDGWRITLKSTPCHFNLPILRGIRVTRVARRSREFTNRVGDRTFSCANVIVATGAYSSPWIPDSSALLNPSIQQVHSSGYRRPEDVVGDDVLVVGFGTSGIEIAIELAAAGRCVSSSPGVQRRRPFPNLCLRSSRARIRFSGSSERLIGTSCIV